MSGKSTTHPEHSALHASKLYLRLTNANTDRRVYSLLEIISNSFLKSD